MAQTILVTGGTGTLGRVVVAQLLEAGTEVRVLSRGHRLPGPAQHLTGDLRSGAGLDEALSGVDVVVHCADPAGPLIQAARRAEVRHLVMISIVGIDRIPVGMYQHKLADEQLLAASGLGWSVQRATQFHDLLAVMLRMLAKSPVMLLPARWRFQSIDTTDVAARLATLAQGEPAGRMPDVAGPAVRSLADLAGSYLSIVGKHRTVCSLPVPGRIARAYAEGANLAPDQAVGRIGFEDYLTRQVAAGVRPYGDAIRDYTRRRPRGQTR